MDILVTGGSGQVGLELQRLQLPSGVVLHAPGRAEFDLESAPAIAQAVAARPWAAVINTAAYTAVDRAESDVVAAWRLNALAPAALATATAAAGIPLVHVSTDFVFDGAKEAPYVEDDAVGPLGVYGASKEGGEQAVRTANPRHVIARTAWVVSPHRANFLKTMLRLGAERPVLRVVADQRGCPTSAADLAAALLAIALRLARDPDAPTGTFHVVNDGEATWHGLAEAIFAKAARRGRARPVVEAIGTADYPTPARRPANSRLSCAKLGAAYGLKLRPWQPAIGDILDELLR
jgi:dTDP-4-dehydrorhamnose reductase